MNIYYAYRAEVISDILNNISCLTTISTNRSYKIKDSNYKLVIVFTDRGTIISPFFGEDNDYKVSSWDELMSNIPEEAAMELIFNLDIFKKYS